MQGVEFTVPAKQKDIQECSLDELVCKVRSSGQVKLPRYWSGFVVKPGTVPSHYSAMYCYAEMSRRINDSSTSGHPVATIDQETERRPVAILPSKYVIADVEHVLVRGYLSDDEKVVNSAQVADQMAYLHTKKSDGASPTFPETGNKPLTGFETMPKALSLCPPEIGPDHNANRFKYFSMYQANNPARGQAKVKLGMSLDCTDARVEVQSEKVRFLKTHPPVMTGVCTIDNFYVNLQKHRAIRGEDNNPRSRLTAGFYIASMTRSNESVFWVTTDIIRVLDHAGLDTVFIHNPQTVKATVVQALIANKKSVVIRGRAPFGYKANENLTYAESYQLGSLLYDSTRLYDAPAVAGKNAIATYSDEEMKARILNWGFAQTGCTIAMAHVYFHPSMTQSWFPYLIPSVHCHAGHMIMINKEVNAAQSDREQELKKQVLRASIANKFKTNFPVGRMTFVRADRSAPDFLWSRGFIFPSRMVEKTKEMDQDQTAEWAGVDMVITPEESDFPRDEIIVYTEAELSAMQLDQQRRREEIRRQKICGTVELVAPVVKKQSVSLVVAGPAVINEEEDDPNIDYGKI